MDNEVIITNQDDAVRTIKQMDELICAMTEDLSKVTGVSESDIWHETFSHVVGKRNDDERFDRKIDAIVQRNRDDEMNRYFGFD